MIVVIFWDGLRPDFVTPELTPNLYRMGQEGVVFKNHHAVFPSETRVNASSMATGCYPGTHGVVGNRIYVPSVEPQHPLNTGNHEDLLLLSQSESLLSVPTLASTLRDQQKKYAMFSSGSPGSSWVQCAPGEGHMVNVRGVVHPQNLAAKVRREHGDFPPETVPATGRNDLVTDLMVETIAGQKYDVVFGWLCDPDLTQHQVGLGAKLALQAIGENDARLGRVLDVAVDVDVFVCSDHGFSTLADPWDYRVALAGAGFDLDKLIWTGNGIHLKDGYKHHREDIVSFLCEENWVGPIFTAGELACEKGQVVGTFSFDVAGLQHARTPEIMFSRNWSDAANPFGVPGTVYGSGGIASHGSCSPYDMHNVLITRGRSFKARCETELPSGVVDISPTIQHLLFGDVVTQMDGRVLVEGLAGHDNPKMVGNRVIQATRNGRHQYMQISKVGQTEYIDKGWV